MASLDNADVCCQFLACLTQFSTQLMSQYHKETSICIVRLSFGFCYIIFDEIRILFIQAAVNYLLHDAINLLLHSAHVQSMLIVNEKKIVLLFFICLVVFFIF